MKPQFPWLINRSILMHSSIVIACCYIKPGDELYVDYRLGPDLPAHMVPSWYRHVDSDGARSRLSSSPRVEECASDDTGADPDAGVAMGVGGNEWATPLPIPPEAPTTGSDKTAPGQRGGKEEKQRLKVVR